jgi:hypothetical protein
VKISHDVNKPSGKRIEIGIFVTGLGFSVGFFNRTYQLVLIGSHGGENRFGEDVGTELFTLQVDDRPSRVAFHPPDEVHSRLVPMHRIQHNLYGSNN